MEKSIENIWTKGFLNSEELKAPKINDLYNRKSELLISKLKRTYTIDNNSLIPIAVVLGITLSLFGHYLAAIYCPFLCVSLFFFNRSLLKSLEEIKITTNSYEYLVIYREKIKNIIKRTKKLIGLFFPLLIIPAYYLLFRNTVILENLTNKFTSLQLLGLTSGFAIFLAILAIGIYKLTTQLLYGKHLSKLNDIITDMEELRA